MGGHAVDIGRDDIWLHPVPGNLFRGIPVADGVYHPEKRVAEVPLAQFGKGPYGNGCRVGILPPVFPDARGISLDVSGVARGGVKGWRKKPDQLVFRVYEVFFDRFLGAFPTG